MTDAICQLGATLTPCQERPYAQEFNMCQRYCVNYNTGNSFVAIAGSSIGDASFLVPYPVPMFKIPSITTTMTDGSYGGSPPGASQWAVFQIGVGYMTKSGTATIDANSLSNNLNAGAIRVHGQTFNALMNALQLGSSMYVLIDAEVG